MRSTARADALPFRRQSLDAVAIDGHERELGRHEETRREDQEQDGE